jgi:hypothetical protein
MSDFLRLSGVYQAKEKYYKRYEFRTQIQSYFTILMWQVFSFINKSFL